MGLWRISGLNRMESEDYYLLMWRFFIKKKKRNLFIGFNKYTDEFKERVGL